MTKQEMINGWKNLETADYYIIGFAYKHRVYMLAQDDINEDYIALDRESSKRGGGLKIRFKLDNEKRLALIAQGAQEIGIDTMLKQPKKNKGEAFEDMIKARFNQPHDKKDSTPFYEAGDMRYNNKEVQIKFEGGQLTTEKQLNRLEKIA